MMQTPDTDADFEFLVNLLASDGAEPDPSSSRAAGSQPEVDHGLGLSIQRGSDGKLDLGQVKAFYENKKMGVGMGVVGDHGPGPMDEPRSLSGNGGGDVGLVIGGDISVSRSASERDDQTGSSSSESSTPASHGMDFRDDLQEHAPTSAPPPSTDSPGRWVDLLSEREAKQLLLEISNALKLKLPLDNGGSGSAPDQPRSLGEVKNVVDFLVRMDELVWRRSEYGANRRVFDPENVSAVEERVRLWERIARGHSSE